jgi:S-adenosyl-L-methionine hydrolase (adenosine-forming)
MIVLFTDYGWTDPYVGQLKAVLARQAPSAIVIDLLHDAPDFNAHAGAHLLAALVPEFPVGSVFVCVVDPGVGGPRGAVAIEADGRWFVGPDNGLLSVVAARAQQVRRFRIAWQPERLSASFHGRDLFAPVAAWLAAGRPIDERLQPIAALEGNFDASDLPRVIYIDHYGNCWTGLRGGLLLRGGDDEALEVKGRRLPWRRVFSEAAKGEAFWYINSVGLIEIAANRASAAELLKVGVGDTVTVAGGTPVALH